MGKIWRVYDDRVMKVLKEYGYNYEMQVKDLRSNTNMYLYINEPVFRNVLKIVENKIYRPNITK